MPIVPPAPVRLSTTTDCFIDSVSFWPIERAMMSLGPPGARGTTSRMVFTG